MDGEADQAQTRDDQDDHNQDDHNQDDHDDLNHDDHNHNHDDDGVVDADPLQVTVDQPLVHHPAPAPESTPESSPAPKSAPVADGGNENVASTTEHPPDPREPTPLPAPHEDHQSQGMPEKEIGDSDHPQPQQQQEQEQEQEEEQGVLMVDLTPQTPTVGAKTPGRKPGRKPGSTKAQSSTPASSSPSSSSLQASPMASPHGTRHRTKATGEPLNFPESSSQASRVAPSTPVRVSKSKPAPNGLIQTMRNDLVAHRAVAAAGIWLAHQEKLWTLFHLETKGNTTLTYVPVSLRGIPPCPPGTLPDLADVFPSATPLLHSQKFLSFRETNDLSSLPDFVPNLQEVAPEVAALLVPFNLQHPSSSSSPFPLGAPRPADSPVTGTKRKAEGMSPPPLHWTWTPF